jgi:2-oxoglutarate dehydrogenase E2 component (dihydrolipoamide succinyltransferase)
MMRELAMPKFNNNDEAYVLVAWMFDEGDAVPANTVLAEIETSKALEELVLDEPAVLHQVVGATAECASGATIALLFDTEQERLDYLSAHPAGPPARGSGDLPAASPGDAPEPVLTRTARALAAEHQVSLDRIRALGKSVVRSADIESLIGQDGGSPVPPEAIGAGRGDGATRPLTRRQRLIGAVVTQSHHAIPAASAAARVDMTLVQGLLKERAAGAGEDRPVAVGPTELMIKAIAAQRESLPALFASLLDDRTMHVPERVGVGVTIDVGTGLFVPVIRDAAALSLTQIASQLMAFRVQALRDSFREEDLAGAHITLSLHNDPGITFAQPIVYPGQAAVVTLCGSERQVTLDAEGRPQWRDYATIGVCYDHRLVNGREAMLFLRAVKRSVEELSC